MALLDMNWGLGVTVDNIDCMATTSELYVGRIRHYHDWMGENVREKRLLGVVRGECRDKPMFFRVVVEAIFANWYPQHFVVSVVGVSMASNFYLGFTVVY